MRQSDARRLAESLMVRHGVGHFSFGWMNSKRTAGMVSTINGIPGGTLKLSTYYVTHATDEAIEETILHEIAHCIVGPREGHSLKWRRVALAIGSNGERCGNFSEEMPNAPKAAWIGKCNAGHEYQQHRAPLRVKFCAKCRGGCIAANMLTWRKNGFLVRTGQMPIRYQREANGLMARWARLSRV